MGTASNGAPAGVFDLLIVGGGINGAGIARDAAGRGLSVLVVEQDDLAAHTSSASTKLIHGGLRYLEQMHFRLVRESLIERERLLGIAPHLIRPLDFVVAQATSPRPAWMLRLGLFLYDHLGGRKALPRTRTIDLEKHPFGEGLRERRGKAFIYSDCSVDDSRLVVLNALDAAERGAEIRTHTQFVEARRDCDGWVAILRDEHGDRDVRARALVNAAGPWVRELFDRMDVTPTKRAVRLVKGSHIVLPRLFEGEQAFLLQNSDGRVVFAIPFERVFTLVGTTDIFWAGSPGPATIDASETEYLLDTVRRNFLRPVGVQDICWTYSGVRALYDDGASSASTVTRDYVLDLDEDGPPLVSVFGGKITTYRRLAEQVMAKLAPFFPDAAGPWTGDKPLPGGEFETGFEDYLSDLQASYPRLPGAFLTRLAKSYGTRARQVLGSAETLADLGEPIGADLTSAEVDYLVAHEWARTAEDILFRRSKLGLHVPAGTAERLDSYLRSQVPAAPLAASANHAR